MRYQTVTKSKRIKQILYMSGVEQQDRMLRHYTCERKTIWCHKKIWINIFQLMMLNTHNLHCRYSGEKQSFYNFHFLLFGTHFFIYYSNKKSKSSTINYLPTNSKWNYNLKKKLFGTRFWTVSPTKINIFIVTKFCSGNLKVMSILTHDVMQKKKESNFNNGRVFSLGLYFYMPTMKTKLARM
jgi:hypothetical protein